MTPAFVGRSAQYLAAKSVPSSWSWSSVAAPGVLVLTARSATRTVCGAAGVGRAVRCDADGPERMPKQRAVHNKCRVLSGLPLPLWLWLCMSLLLLLCMSLLLLLFFFFFCFFLFFFLFFFFFFLRPRRAVRAVLPLLCAAANFDFGGWKKFVEERGVQRGSVLFVVTAVWRVVG